MSVLAKRKLTYGEKIKLKVEVMRMKVKLRKETAAMMDLKEMFRIELTMAGSRIDSRDWRRTAEALRARIGGHRINNVMYWFWIQVNKLLPSHIFA